MHSHIFKKKDQKFYSDGKLTYDMWNQRYLKYLDFLFVAARAQEVNETSNLNLSNGTNVKHIELPNLNSVNGLYSSKKNISEKLSEVIIKNNIDIVIARLPSAHGLIAIEVANSLNKKIVVEMVGDPFDSLWYHGHLLAKLYAPINFIRYKKIFRSLNNIIYVTEEYLQNRYKSNVTDKNTTNISNVNLIEDKNFDISKRLIKEGFKKSEIINLATIGSYSAKYKGIDTGIKVISELKENNYNVHLHILGSGNKEYYSNLIKQNNLKENIHFINQLQGGRRVLEWLDTFDFYIHPSLTEGLPRALIEAMSRGLPSIASNVGGIPELLDKRMMANPRDYKSMAGIITNLIEEKDYYNEQVLKNYEKSKDYKSEALEAKRDVFWNNIKGEKI